MTRETKIGLLVGLAFIIVVGILLSEHLTTSTERPAAPLAEAGEGVREGVAAPGVAMQPAPYRPADPIMPVPTARDFAPQPTPVPSHVAIGPNGAGQSPIVINDRTNPQWAAPAGMDTQTGVNPLIAGPIVQNTIVDPIITRIPVDPFANDPRHIAANGFGEQLIPVNGNSNANPNQNTTLAANNVREYKAQPGDSLSRIAALLPGGNTKSNRDAVVKLNPALQKDPNKIIAGRNYLLPTDTTTSNPAPAPIPAPVVEQPTAVVRTPEPTAAYRTYIVKKGDNLSKIASEQLGSKNEIATIRTLNADVLKNGDVIWIDMKLKLPAKVVATGD